MQQINLYQDVLLPPREILSLRQLMLLGGAMLTLLLSVNVVQALLIGKGRQAVAQQQIEKSRLQTQLHELELAMQQRARENNAEDLKVRLAHLEQQLQTRQQVLQLVGDKHIGNVTGFATQLSGLARQRVEGLWLTGLSIHDGGEKLNLRGSATQPELLPKYLQRLATEPSFHGIEFKTFVMQRSAHAEGVDFDLRSTTDKQPE